MRGGERDTGRQGNQADEGEPDKDKLKTRTEESDRTRVETNEGEKNAKLTQDHLQ